MWNPGNVVMLATKDQSKIYLEEDNKLTGYNYPQRPALKGIAQHLYITSYEEIKEGDWVRDSVGSIRQADSLDLKFNYPKIIATTDTSLSTIPDNETFQKLIAEIPQSFINHFITEYNKGNVIDKVLVEYEEKYVNGINLTSGMHFIPTLNPNNTINIKAVKDSWGREEHISDVTEIAKMAYNKALLSVGFSEIEFGDWFYKWIKYNLK